MKHLLQTCLVGLACCLLFTCTTPNPTPSSPTASTDICGIWSGTFTSGSDNGNVTLNLTLSSNTSYFTGTSTITGPPSICVGSNPIVTGTINGTSINVKISSSSNSSIAFSGTLGNTINGSFTSNGCSGAIGNASIRKVSGSCQTIPGQSCNNCQNSVPAFGSLPSKPEGQTKYDSSSYGLYKGIIAGKIDNSLLQKISNSNYQSYFVNKSEASGVLRIDIFNSDPKKAFCVLFVNGFYDTLVPPQKNGQFLDSYGKVFDGSLEIYCRMESQKMVGGQRSIIDLSITNNGYYVESLSIPGVKLNANIFKETSYFQTLIFNGDYKGNCSSSTSPSGTFNMIILLNPFSTENIKNYTGEFGLVQYFGSDAVNGTTTIKLKIGYQFDLTTKEVNFYGSNQDKFTSFGITGGDPVDVTSNGDPNISSNFYYDRNVTSMKGKWSVVQPGLSANTSYSCSGTWSGTRQN
ncbi:MAG: hypothetical protein SFY32_10870 [Bacteroidota bacterium]|nr:hypothetical protein [Bacteroidota bacterium]